MTNSREYALPVLSVKNHPLSRRDEFAKAAMQAYLHPEHTKVFTARLSPDPTWETLQRHISQCAIAQADSIIAQLDNTSPQKP